MKTLITRQLKILIDKRLHITLICVAIPSKNFSKSTSPPSVKQKRMHLHIEKKNVILTKHIPKKISQSPTARV